MNIINLINGGVTAAHGFTASGIHCGIRRNKEKKDLALIYSEIPANAAAVYTKNIVCGAPLTVTKKHLEDGIAQAVICNSGNANTCNENGVKIAQRMSELVGDALGISADNVVVASTGVIGQPLDLAPIESGIPMLAGSLGKNSLDATLGIMTTDTRPKQIAIEFMIGDRVCRMGGIAKGSGMIHPDMATMLVFITTDVNISSEMLSVALAGDVDSTFNMLSIDGDTSTNDMVVIMANGMAKNDEITSNGEDFAVFMRALNTVTVALCRMIAADGEGATKLLECHVSGALDCDMARKAAKAVVCSSLVKTAMFGADANWGRILCAIGYSKCGADADKISVSFSSRAGEVTVCRDGHGVDFSEETAKKVLLEDEIDILISLGLGSASSVAWGCDLTYDYVKINGDYRT